MRFKKNKNIWISVSDLMAGTLAIFIFYFVIQSINLQLEIKNIEEERKSYKEVVDEIYSVKVDIIESIKKELDVNIDEKTGSIRLDSSILFDSGKYQLKSKGKQYLKEIMPKYLEILLMDEKIRENLSDIIIEGHTDKKGSYGYNLDLSQKRANSVAQYILSEEFGSYTWKVYLQRYLTANGRSYSFYLGEHGTREDKASRRVEIKFQLNDAEAIEKLKQLIEGIEN